MKYWLSTIVSIILWVLIGIMLFFVGSGIWQRFANKDGYTGFFGTGYAVVVSGSMVPNLLVDDMIIYQAHEPEDFRVGDIIVYVRDPGTEKEMLITHRIVALNGDRLTTKGDANSRPDDEINFSQVVGRVVWRVAGIGNLIRFLRSGWGIALTVVIILLTVALNLWLTFGRTKRKKVRTVFGDRYLRY